MPDQTPELAGLSGQRDAKTSVEAWFTTRGWVTFEFQREVWDAYRRGESGLIHSATGSGKTLAAWLGPLMDWIAEDGASDAAPPLTVLWITPMRALSADTRESLLKPIEGMRLPWTIGIRTGDTSSSERTKQNRRMPSALITTPESLSLMLSQAGAHDQLASVQAVVVDEWHELLGSKRGVQTELALTRLRRWNPALRVWGLSATLGNLEEAMDVLLAGAPGSLIEGVRDKRIIIDTLIPDDMQRFPWAGHLGFAMVNEVAREIELVRVGGGTTLVFTNTRSQAELWYQALLEAKPEWAGEIALHHGSLDREVRDYVERGLKQGTLKCVVATSSLDLGVDFAPVERVLQIGSAKGVARLLQRAGRSGHSPGRASRVTCVPSHAFEFIEAAAARRAAEAKKIEVRRAIERPLDVLVQHLVTIAAGEGFIEQELLDEVRTTYAYRQVTQEEWAWALDFVVKGGDALTAYPEYRKVAWHDGRYRVPDTAIARRHRMSIGTIVSDASMDVRYLKGSRLGNVEESFIARLSPGDAFTFAGRTLELISFSVNDYGFELLSVMPFALNREIITGLLSTDRLLESVLDSLNAAELSKRHFREIARVAGLVFAGFPGANKTNRQVQATSGLIYDVFAQWDKDNPLLSQSRREVLERELEFTRLREALLAMQQQRITIIRPERPTPFSFPLMVERFREKLTSEKLADRIARMQLIFDKVRT